MSNYDPILDLLAEVDTRTALGRGIRRRLNELREANQELTRLREEVAELRAELAKLRPAEGSAMWLHAEVSKLADERGCSFAAAVEYLDQELARRDALT